MPPTVLQPLRRITTPFPRPHTVCFADGRVWMTSVATKHLYALDPQSFAVLEDHEAPGTPWGMVCTGDEVRVLCGVTDEDYRLIYRFRDGAFQPDPIPSPDDTGSQLSYDGRHLHVSQWYRRRLLALDEKGKVVADYEAPHGIAGHVIVGPHAYLLGTDDEAVTPYWISRLDLASGTCTDIAVLPFLARGLGFDGRLFWSNVREQGELIAFELPDA